MVNIATSFEEVATRVILDANECVLNVNITTNTIRLGKVLEMMQMIIILSNKAENPIITKLLEEMMKYLGSINEKGTLEQNTVDAASGLALKLVKASLIKKIHNEIMGNDNTRVTNN